MKRLEDQEEPEALENEVDHGASNREIIQVNGITQLESKSPESYEEKLLFWDHKKYTGLVWNMPPQTSAILNENTEEICGFGVRDFELVLTIHKDALHSILKPGYYLINDEMDASTRLVWTDSREYQIKWGTPPELRMRCKDGAKIGARGLLDLKIEDPVSFVTTIGKNTWKEIQRSIKENIVLTLSTIISKADLFDVIKKRAVILKKAKKRLLNLFEKWGLLISRFEIIDFDIPEDFKKIFTAELQTLEGEPESLSEEKESLVADEVEARLRKRYDWIFRKLEKILPEKSERKAKVESEKGEVIEEIRIKKPKVLGRKSYYRNLGKELLELIERNMKDRGGIIRLADLYLLAKQEIKLYEFNINDLETVLQLLNESGLIGNIITLESGVKLIEIIPIELSNDQKLVLDYARDRPYLTVEDLITFFGWHITRAERVLEALVSCDIARVSSSYAEGKRWYFPALSLNEKV